MTGTVIFIIVIVVFLAAFFIAAHLLGLPLLGRAGGSSSSVTSSIRTIVSAQRYSNFDNKQKKQVSVMDTAGESRAKRVSDSRLTLTKLLKYARWRIPPLIYRLLQVMISTTALVFVTVVIDLNVVMKAMSLLTGPILMNWLLNTAVLTRFNAFDRDYPAFLLSLVGLLKTGMDSIGALQASAEGLEDDSVVKSEVQLMIERLRLGISEEQSIGSFGEDIFHPEIELFVQALLLSRRVGGTLSDTLERLAKQVRKRQYFRQSARAAVGQQRGSILGILGILVFLEGYIYIMAPDLITAGLEDPLGWQIWQVGITVILLGMFWIRQVTKMKI